MSVVKAKIIDRVITFTERPLLYSHAKNVDYLQITFDDEWTGYTKTAVFYRDIKEPYAVLMDDNTATIPPEVMETDGKIYMGVFGVKDNEVLNSEVVFYPVGVGALTEGAMPEVTPDLWQDIISRIEEIKETGANIGQYVETATEAAETATTKAQEAQTSATTASAAATNATKAQTAAETAQSKAESARTMAQSYTQQANNAKTDAVQAKADAESAKADAETAKTGAESARNTAEDYAESAENAKTQAETAKTQAVNAKNEAVEAANNAAAEFEDSISVLETVTGESVTVDDSAEDVLYGLKLYGKSVQQKEPGKNLSSVSTLTVANGAIESNYGYLSHDLPAGTYTISGVVNCDDYVWIEFRNQDGPVTSAKLDKSTGGERSSGTVALSKTVNILSAYSATGTINNIQIEAGETATAYEPYKEWGTPSPTAPVPIEVAGSDGSIDVSLTGKNIAKTTTPQSQEGDTPGEYEPYTKQTLTVTTPNGLPAVPVESGGNYTDASGQQWVSDYIDFERGKYVSLVLLARVESSLNWKYSVMTNRFYATDSRYKSADADGPIGTTVGDYRCTHFEVSATQGADDLGITYINRNTKGFAYTNFVLNGDVEAWKAFLDENEVYTLGRRSAPVETDLSAEQISAYKALHTNEGTTNVFTDTTAGIELTYRNNRQLADNVVDVVQKKAIVPVSSVNGKTGDVVLTGDDIDIPEATTSNAGLMSASDKLKLAQMLSIGDVFDLTGRTFETSDFTIQAGIVAKNQTFGFYLLGEDHGDMEDLPESAVVSGNTPVLFTKYDGVPVVAYLFAKNGLYVQEYETAGGFAPESPHVPLTPYGWIEPETGSSTLYYDSVQTSSGTVESYGYRIHDASKTWIQQKTFTVTLSGEYAGWKPRAVAMRAVTTGGNLIYCPAITMKDVEQGSGGNWTATLEASYIIRGVDAGLGGGPTVSIVYTLICEK